MPRYLISLVLISLIGLTRLRSAEPDFEKQIAPLLSSHCLSCHSGAKPQGGLDLTRRVNVLNPDVIVPKNAAASLLWQRVEADEMPPKKPLSEAEKILLKQWIQGGAAWGDDPINPLKYTTSTRAGLDWWSLKPLNVAEPPPLASHPIDAFLEAKRREKQLSASPPVDRRRLIRRLYFDLIGLPPSPEAVEQFLGDQRPDAVTLLIEELLASPHYGERWARHWLDVVRYGESQGFERNDPRPHAWHYRDWVIRSLNLDMPYDEFVRWQIAGDVLHPGQPDGLKATGYLVAGIHNTVLPNQEQAKQTARQDELEDLVGNISQTFLGLSAQCARCHDHKFDPISQQDYYQLAASVSGVTHNERSYDDLQVIQKRKPILEQLDHLAAKLEAQAQPIRAKWGQGQASPPPPAPVASWDFQDAATAQHLTLLGGAQLTSEGLVLNGKTSFARTKPLPFSLREKTLEVWVKLANLEQRGGGLFTLQTPDGNRFDSIVFAEQAAKEWLAGSDFFRRTKPLQGPAETASPTEWLHLALTYSAEGTITAYRNGELYGKPYRSDGPMTFPANEYVAVFGLRHEPAGGNRHWAGTLQQARLYDKALSLEEVRRSGKHRRLLTEPEILAAMPEGDRATRQDWLKQREQLQEQLKQLDAVRQVKIFTNKPIQPSATRLLIRGQVTDPGQVVRPGGLSALPKSDFQLDPASAEAERRRRLADWLTAPENPLLARVMVNRVWQYHFGVGLVDTPNDFGFNGSKPSHPELLDWLAHTFRQQQYSLKKLHKLILTSQAYQQSSRWNADAAQVDAESRLLWRKRPQRLDAETLRDAMLSTTGLLNRQAGGPSFSDYRIIPNNGTTYYEPYDPVGPEFHRRSIYRFVPRGANPGLLDAFDCPDPAGAAPRRANTTTPLQALSLWNGDFALRLSKALADRAQQAHPQLSGQVRAAFRFTLQRPPTGSEQAAAEQLAREHGLRALCRALFNSNEFLTID